MKKIKTFFNSVKDEHLNIISFILLLIWTTSPTVAYILKKFFAEEYREYFTYIIYIIGLIGIGIYFIYLIKIKNKDFNIKNFIPETLITTLLIISYLSSILCKNPKLAFLGERYRKEGLIIYIMYIVFLLLSSTLKNKKYIKYLFTSIIISGLIITILPFFEKNFTYNHFSNIFHQFNHYGYYLMINTMLTAFMIIDSKIIYKKILYSLIYIFFLYLLIRNNTFGCFLAISISFILLFIYSITKKYERKNIIIIILIFIITSFCTSFFDIKIGENINHKNTKGIVSDNFLTFSKDIKNIINKDEKGLEKAGTGRGLLWKEAINYSLKHPLLGGGMEHLRNYYHKKGITYNDRPHNIILQISSFIGIPGAIIYIIFILYIAISNLKSLDHETIHIMTYFTAMCYFISSLFGNSMYYTSPYFMILLGLLVGYKRVNNI